MWRLSCFVLGKDIAVAIAGVVLAWESSGSLFAQPGCFIGQGAHFLIDGVVRLGLDVVFGRFQPVGYLENARVGQGIGESDELKDGDIDGAKVAVSGRVVHVRVGGVVGVVGAD